MSEEKNKLLDLREDSTEKLRLQTDADSVRVDPMNRDGVTNMVLSGYAVGHFANDLCASMWFIYLSYYLINVVKLTQNISGLCLLSG